MTRTDDPAVTRLAALDDALRAGTFPSECPSTDIVPALGTLRALDALRPRTSEPFRGPRRLGRFRLDRELGRGGFGVVFLAHDPALDRPVALKIPFPHVLTSPDLLERFRREAKAAARLAHPHIVPVHDVGLDPPTLFIASEFVPGGTLAARLGTHGPLLPRAAAELIAALADGVAYAHDRKIVHRDIKPANVLLDESAPDSLNPKLTDFGLAAMADAGGDALTRSGSAMGTPHYMAPEQARGRGGRVGPTADVYGLGAVLYECLTGRPPFAGESDADTIQQVLNDDPIPPRRLRPGLPLDIETIALCCLTKEPSGRYPSAADLAVDLRRFLACDPVAARPVGPVGRFVRQCRRRPVVAGLGVALGAAVLVGTVGIGWQSLRAETRRAEAVASLEKTDGLLTHTRTSLDEMIELGRQLSCQHGNREMGRQILSVARDHFGRVLAETEDIELRRQAMLICLRLSDSQTDQDRLTETIALREEALAHAERLDEAGRLDPKDRLELIEMCVAGQKYVMGFGSPRDRWPWFLDQGQRHLAKSRALDPLDSTMAMWNVSLWSQRAAVAADAEDAAGVLHAFENAAAVAGAFPVAHRKPKNTAVLALSLAHLAESRLLAGQIDEAVRAADASLDAARALPLRDADCRPRPLVLAEALRAAVRSERARADDRVLSERLDELVRVTEDARPFVTAYKLPEVSTYLATYHRAIDGIVDGGDVLGRHEDGTARLEKAVNMRLEGTWYGVPCRPLLANVSRLIERLVAAGRARDARRVADDAKSLIADWPHPSPADKTELNRLRKRIAEVSGASPIAK